MVDRSGSDCRKVGREDGGEFWLFDDPGVESGAQHVPQGCRAVGRAADLFQDGFHL